MYSKVYFILAHKKPEQISSLISLLQDGKSYFFIHLDKNVDINLFESIRQIKHCYFIKKRERSRWGGFGILQSTLNGMVEIQSFMELNHSAENFHCILLSGEDLPIRTNDEIHHFLENKQEKSFINYWKLPYDKWWNGGFFRLESLYMFDFIKHPKAHYWLNRIIRKLNFHFVFAINRIKKKYPDVKLYGSSQWMILSKKMMDSIINKTNENKQFKQLFKYVLAPDELYIITLVQNFIKTESFLIENSPTHLVLFNGVDANPQYVSIDDIQKNKTEVTLFARKFEDTINGDAITYIKNTLNQ